MTVPLQSLSQMTFTLHSTDRWFLPVATHRCQVLYPNHSPGTSSLPFLSFLICRDPLTVPNPLLLLFVVISRHSSNTGLQVPVGLGNVQTPWFSPGNILSLSTPSGSVPYPFFPDPLLHPDPIRTTSVKVRRKKTPGLP